jgi:hypothetical protein
MSATSFKRTFSSSLGPLLLPRQRFISRVHRNTIPSGSQRTLLALPLPLPAKPSNSRNMSTTVQKSEEEWRAVLSPEQVGVIALRYPTQFADTSLLFSLLALI